MKLVFTRSARQDLVRLRAFIAEINPAAATRAAQRIKSTATIIAENPMLGRAVETPDGKREDLRDFPVSFGSYGYVMRYQVLRNQIRILRIWHGREYR